MKNSKKLLAPSGNKIPVLFILMIVILSLSALSSKEYRKSSVKIGRTKKTAPPDSIGSVKAFLAVYSVLMNPACMNCHPSGDTPLIGPESQLHPMGVTRGIDGKGITGLKCKNCHQDTNLPGKHMPPGNPNWKLPPADMKMVFQGKSPRQLAKQLLDPKLNGGKSKADLIKHTAEDKLVIGSWDHGGGKSVPPISHDEFVAQMKLWLEKGAYLPAK